MNLAPVMCNQLSNQLAQIFVSEIQKHLLPVVGARLDGIKTQIQAEVAQKLSITDKVIKENILNICKSKVSDSLKNRFRNSTRNKFWFICSNP